jgi:hypothetical protein
MDLSDASEKIASDTAGDRSGDLPTSNAGIDKGVSGIIAPLIRNIGTTMKRAVKFRTKTLHVREINPVPTQWEAKRAQEGLWIVLEHLFIFYPAEIQTPIF